MKLTEIIAQVERAVDAVDFSEEIRTYDIGAEHQRHLRARTPYRCRAALVKVLGAATALEVGTKTGCGALALAKYARRVVTCDLTLDLVSGGGTLLGQDLYNLPRIQAGMRSRGYTGLHLGDQEVRIRHFHQTLDAYLGGA